MMPLTVPFNCTITSWAVVKRLNLLATAVLSLCVMLCGKCSTLLPVIHKMVRSITIYSNPPTLTQHLSRMSFSWITCTLNEPPTTVANAKLSLSLPRFSIQNTSPNSIRHCTDGVFYCLLALPMPPSMWKEGDRVRWRMENSLSHKNTLHTCSHPCTVLQIC